MKTLTSVLALAIMMAMTLVSTVIAVPAPTDGAIQFSGVGAFAAEGECTDPAGQGATFAMTLTGDLSGCHYVFVEYSRCTAGGAYYETGTELFIGNFNGEPGTFETDYIVTAKYRDCPNLVGEVAGRCQHPFTGGTGVFEGLREARFTMRDNVTAGNFPYRGHILY